MNDELRTYSLTSDARRRIADDIRAMVERSEDIIFSVIFGSFADQERPFFRDIDVAVFLDPSRVPENRRFSFALELGAEMEKRFTPYPIDVLVLNDAPLSVAFRATQGEPLFTRNDSAWIDFVTRTWSLYHDHALTSRDVLKELMKA